MKKMCMMLLAALASTGSLFAQICLNDGHLYDWSRLPEECYSERYLWGGAAYQDLISVRFCADQFYIYYMLEYNPETVEAFEILLDVDGNSTNGYSWPWKNCGADYMLEALLGEGQNINSDLALFHWNGGEGSKDWGNWTEIKEEIDASVSNPILIGSGHKVVEGKIYYPSLFSKIDSLKVGVLALKEWNAIGVIPQINVGDTVSQYPMLNVNVVEQDSVCLIVDSLGYGLNLTKQTATVLRPAAYCPNHVCLRKTISFEGEDYDVNLGDDVYQLFQRNTDIRTLELQEGWAEIRNYVFAICTNLESVILPSTLQTIGDACFYNCTGLQKIIVKATTPPTISATTFDLVSSETLVYVPDESVDLYKADAFWGQFNIRPMSSLYQGVHSTKMDTKATKRIVNGQLLIDRDGKTYNALGWH